MYSITRLCILFTLLLASPLLGLVLAGLPFPTQLTLLPTPTTPGISSISWMAWGILAVCIVVTVTPPIFRMSTFSGATNENSRHSTTFPWWGWIAFVSLVSSWILAWTRFDWFEPWQPHTFPLLWLSYIALLNALTFQRSNHCLLTHRLRLLGQLFLLSAGFWWTFEYLNQYVNNWHYENIPPTSQLEYLFFTSLAFSTVLPALVSTYEWLATFPFLTKPYKNWHKLPWRLNPQTGRFLLIQGVLGLTVIGIWPAILFPLLWLGPLSLLLGIQLIKKEGSSFSCLNHRDWRPVILSALAALVCGFWWELWNAGSLVHWKYSIPYVHAFKLFEMPILGYAGYLPFGLTCLTITEYALGYQSRQPHLIPVRSNYNQTSKQAP